MAPLARGSSAKTFLFGLSAALFAVAVCFQAGAQEPSKEAPAGKKDVKKDQQSKQAPEPAKKPTEGVKKAGLELDEGAANAVDEAGRARSIVRSGYTRPGNPPDRRTEKGTIKHVDFEPGYKGIGGTIYFMVLKLHADEEHEGDNWGTGVRNFNSSFVQGLDVDQTFSPALDTRAKYLYLYQVVNDRGMEPLEIRPAANVEIGTVPVASTTLRLRIDPRYITSWGYFKNIGFVMPAPDRTLSGETPGAALGAEPKTRIIAVSATPPIISELPEQMFKFRSPAYVLPLLRRLGPATENLNKLATVTDLQKKVATGVPVANWGRQLLQATKAAREPNLVQLAVIGPGYWSRVLSRELEAGGEAAPAAGGGGGGVRPAVLGEGAEALPAPTPLGVEGTRLAALEGGELAAAGTGVREIVFRADWSAKNLVNMGQHSVVFGFTSDLPPIDEPIVLADAAFSEQTATGAAAGIRPAQIGAPGAAPGAAPGVAPGTAPAPAPPPPAAPAAPAAAGGLGGGLMGGGLPAGGAGIPAGLGGGLGGLGTGTPAAVTGGGGGTPGSGSSSSTPGTGTSRSKSGSRATPVVSVVTQVGAPIISIINTVSQQQSQQQQQSQRQGQHQGQHQGGHGHGHHGHVVPEPSAIWLGLLALPALVVFSWRRRKAGLAGA
jgi:hypothetical protein